MVVAAVASTAKTATKLNVVNGGIIKGITGNKMNRILFYVRRNGTLKIEEEKVAEEVVKEETKAVCLKNF